MDARIDMARELTVDEALALAASGWWKTMTQTEAARLQLHQDRLCMPFGDFCDAMKQLLGRPVYTYEFAASDALIAEAEGKRDAPASPLHSLTEIVGPEKAAKAIVVIT